MATAAPPPTLRRDPARGVVGGVCAGLAVRLGIDARLLRAAFVVLTILGGLGIPAYAIAWALLPAVPGSERHGRRASVQIAVGAGLLLVALMLSLGRLGLLFSEVLVWPLVLAGVGGALLWRQGRARPAAPVAVEPDPAERAAGVYRGGFGVALVIGAGMLFLYSNGALGPLRDVILALVVVGVGLALILSPFLWRLARTLAGERSERIRSQERAEVAAHLHDSVLQTLALVQKRADDPRAVATLARRQERELRAWLFSPSAPGPDASLAAALQVAAAEVEEAHGIPIEVVTVGDAPLDEPMTALLAAAREALANAAKFAGDAGPVALYCECDDARVQAFIRDRGPGFDPADVPADRRGVRESILARMERHGGHAAVHAAPGGGTEIELALERQASS